MAAKTGFRIGHDPDTVRRPTLGSFGRSACRANGPAAIFKARPISPWKWSPDDRAGEVLAKVRDWLSAGCQAVWVVDPTSQTVSVYRGPHDTALLTAAEELTDDRLLPGFCLRVAEVF